MFYVYEYNFEQFITWLKCAWSSLSKELLACKITSQSSQKAGPINLTFFFSLITLSHNAGLSLNIISDLN